MNRFEFEFATANRSMNRFEFEFATANGEVKSQSLQFGGHKADDRPDRAAGFDRAARLEPGS